MKSPQSKAPLTPLTQGVSSGLVAKRNAISISIFVLSLWLSPLIFLPIGKGARLVMVALSFATALGSLVLYRTQGQNAKLLQKKLDKIEKELLR